MGGDVGLVLLNDTATTEIKTYCHILSRHLALPIAVPRSQRRRGPASRRPATRPASGTSPCRWSGGGARRRSREWRSEAHTSELQSLMRISYAVFCLKKKHTDGVHSRQEIRSNTADRI